ncbi:hypothetical protein PF008_g12099 [Phytophthora fragariae]|uniref:Uncharacterized protein n=1 Tax=Phytophthora fragariae TaxID=53985 RepID=A0A6G0RNZ8_9STRA|nr:hypothetical protein PF008_g12099 [Phytophthora fragariae]
MVGTPAPIATSAGAPGGSSRAVRRRRRLRLRLRRPPLADRRRHRQRLLLRRSRSEQQRLFRLRRTPVEARVEPFDADAASDCDSGGHPWQIDEDTGSDSCSGDQGRSSSGYSDSGGRLWRLESSRSTQTPPPIATPAATPGRSTETPAATPAPTIKVGAAAAIPTPADASGGSSPAVRRRRRLRLRLRRPPLADRRRHQQRLLLRRSRSEQQRLFRLRRTPVEARVEPFDADAASDCDSGGHPWQIDGDTGSVSCSGDQEFALSSERRDSRQPATPLIGAGWCFHYTKSFKATWHSVARGDVVLQLQQRTQGNRPQRRSGRGGASTTPRQASRQPGITSLEAGSCFNYSKLLLRHKRDEIDKAYMYTHSR